MFGYSAHSTDLSDLAFRHPSTTQSVLGLAYAQVSANTEMLFRRRAGERPSPGVPACLSASGGGGRAAAAFGRFTDLSEPAVVNNNHNNR